MSAIKSLKRHDPGYSPGVAEQKTRSDNPARSLPRLVPKHLPSNWCYMLPEAKGYFGRRIAGLRKPNATGWAQGKCPFHEDHTASFSVNVKWDRPHWHCCGTPSCGSGDMVDFHMLMYGLDFPEAVAQLLQGDV